MTCLLGEGHVQRQNVGDGQCLFKVDACHVRRKFHILAEVRIARGQLELKRPGTIQDRAGDPAITDGDKS